MTILDEIAARTKKRIEEEKEANPPREVSRLAEEVYSNMIKTGTLVRETADGAGSTHRLYDALSKPGISYICEVKKASPSKGLIAEDFLYRQIAMDYEAAGASAISCLTEPYWFLGSDRYLSEIAGDVKIPILRKDFTVDRYMVDQARILGASAILLICAILSDDQLVEFKNRADELGLDCLVEAHNEEEIKRAIEIGAGIIGVNNRNLHDFSVDTSNALRLRELIPKDVLYVSESGIQTPDDIASLREAGVDAVLIGETLMRAFDKKAKLAELNGGEL